MSKNKRKIILGVVVLLVLVISFFAGSDFAKPPENTANPVIVAPQEQKEQSKEQINLQKEPSQDATVKAADKKDTKETISEPEKSEETEQQQNADERERLCCNLTVNCFSVLENFDKLDYNKKEIIPKDGIILKEITVEFFPDESAFDVLRRELKNRNIQLEYVLTPAYNSAYIEGIANLYEFDCGELSGWMYKVNGIKPTYGCSQYKLKDGDKIEFFYSCDMFK